MDAVRHLIAQPPRDLMPGLEQLMPRSRGFK
jgi:hypothetical protein